MTTNSKTAGIRWRWLIGCLVCFISLIGPLACNVCFAAQGAGRMLYSVPNNTFFENPIGDSNVKVINDGAGSVAALQTSINSTRSNFPSAIILIRLTNSVIYSVSNSSLVLGSRECLMMGSGVTIKAASSLVTVPLIQINSGATNVSVSGGKLDGNGANIYGVFVTNADRVNVDRVAVVKCGLGGVAMAGSGNTNFDNELTISRCDISGCSAGSGISIQEATQSACIENYCHGNSTGIFIGCAYGTFANNVCTSNTIGIDFRRGNDNVIANNTCNYNGIGILADGTNSMIVSQLFASNTVAGINSSGKGNAYIDNVFSSGNATAFINGGAGDKVVAYKAPLSATGQTYFYPPLINDQHTNSTIVNGKGRTDLTINSTTIDSVQSQYAAALATNPTNVLVLHLNGTFTVGATPLSLSSNTCVLLNGTIQVNGSTTAPAIITNATSPDQVSFSGGVIDGGGNTNIEGISFTSSAAVQIDAVKFQNFGASNPRGGSDVIHFSGNATPMMVTRCTITNGSARGIWLQQSGGKCLVSENDVSFVNMDGVDCDSFTSGAVVKFNYCHDLLRDGVFIEQGSANNLALGNLCSNVTNKCVNLFNNAITNSAVQYNNVIGNWCLGGNGLRNGSSARDTFTSHNFFFNNTLINSAIQSQHYGTENYFSQNYLIGATITTNGGGNEVFFNSTNLDAYLNLQDANSLLYAVVTNAATNNGAAIVLGPADGLGSDLWQLIPTDSGFFQIQNKKSGKAVNVTGAAITNGALVSQQAFSTAKSDQWMPISAGNGLFNFSNRLSGLYLDVSGANTSTGTKFDQQSYSGAANQQINLNLIALAKSFPTNRVNLTFSATATNIQLTWPTNYLGCILQAQTNTLFTNNWTDVSSSALTNVWSINFNQAIQAVFYRLRFP